ncbi:hypothetical protein ANCCEY_11101 [Ancylostoma ceylanicum]|uniref:Uncharacterized protein n=1 Tax=Ancylostoma ceylanicum TaxID=53326 RepID=A0A0D6LIR9_9BILA|nr:hypothetical protein ANCCEY_11101 [Ancylostoma ceylanicum]
MILDDTLVLTRHQYESFGKKSEPLSPNPSGSHENVKPILKKKFMYGDRKRKFTREENEGKSESAPDRKSSDEKTDRKSDEKEKKEKKDSSKKSEKDVKGTEGASAKQEEKRKPGTDGKLQDAKTQMTEARTLSATRPPSARAKPSYNEVTAIPGDLALLAAAEQMALDDKGDYDNFGPPAAK